MPKDLKDTLDIQSMEYSNTSFISPELKKTFSDVILKIQLKEMIDKSNYISLLIEHKSSPSEYIFFQLLGYLANGYLTQLKNKSDLHPIIPIIYYQGEKEWKVKNINHVFDDYPESIKKYLPDFRYIFVALHQMSEESLLELRNSMLYSALMLQMHHFEPIKMIAQFEKNHHFISNKCI
ncbi:MAG: Rpn family recombination-promoting nuclease/putative transposase [Saprospiraceae bacterium]|nr:Rpn family recombination-promoting nuclease/putative transposase [Saprospiraceae bacterium]